MVTLVVGLGNPGRRYAATRHNIGFMIVEAMRARAGKPREEERAHCAVCRAEFEGREVVLARPLLYMNRSGAGVRELLSEVARSPEEMLVVCDDFHLDFGHLRLRRQGSHGGHNGLRSVIDALGTREFPRLRVGIGAAWEGKDEADYVLASFGAEERERLPDLVDEAADCVEMVLRSGLETSMSRFNRKPAGAPVAPAPDTE